jgi:hypothetical protein
MCGRGGIAPSFSASALDGGERSASRPCHFTSEEKALGTYCNRPWRSIGLWDVEAPTFSRHQLTDGGKVVSPMRRPPFSPRKIPGTHFCFFLILVCEAIGTAASPGLLCQPRVIVKMIVEKQMECRLAGETEVLGENLPQRHFCQSQNPTWPEPGLNPGRRGGKPATHFC